MRSGSMPCSEDEQVDKAAPGMQSADDLRQQRRDRQHFDPLARRRRVEPKGGHGVGHHQAIEGGIADRLVRARHEQTVRHHREHAARAGLTRRLCGAHQRRARTDEVVDHERGRARDLPNEQIARDDAGAAVLFGKAFADRLAERFLERLAEDFCAFRPACIRGNDGERPIDEALGVVNE